MEQSQGISTKKEQPPREILIPKEVAKPFGRWMRQHFEGPMNALQGIITSKQLNQETDTHLQNIVGSMPTSLAKIHQVIAGLENAREVRLSETKGGWTFQFSEEMEKETPTPGEVIMQPALALPFLDALRDNIGNPLSTFRGYSEVVKIRRGNSFEREDYMEKLDTAALQMYQTLELVETAKEVKISTNVKGDVALTTGLPFPSIEAGKSTQRQ